VAHQLSLYERWYGRDEPPPEVIALRAGRLSAEFQGGDLRYLRCGSRELVRRVYVAVRDHNWNTIPGRIIDLAVEAGEASFKITYACRHQEGDVDFRWQARLEGREDGTIECALDGTAGTAFRYNRIGFCVLHPVQGIAGQPFWATTPGGAVSGQLPDRIGPQRIENGFEAPLFPSCSSLSITLENGASRVGARLVTEFEGDLFEMEDQRNWSDGSFKTYCTPLSLGYPYQASPGQGFSQQVTIRLEGDLPEREGQEPARSAPLEIALGGETGRRLPALGFGLPAGEEALEQLNLIARLRPDHLKVELHLNDPGWPELLERTARAAGQVGSSLELALFLDEDTGKALARLAERLKSDYPAAVPLARVIVFHEAEAAQVGTSARWMETARRALAGIRPGLLLVGGTNGNFAELNRQPPDPAQVDGVVYTLNPQVHAVDERSLIEAIAAQRDTVESASALAGGRPVIVSAVTLKPPFNQAATEAEGPGDPNRLPAAVDPRQMSLFAAAWTAGSLHSLAAGGAGSVTYYETSGWRGLVETRPGNRLPEQFRSSPGMIFPVYWVFAFLAGARGAALLETRSDRPLLAGALALRGEDQTWLVVASYQPADQEVRLAPLPAGRITRLRLNQDTFAAAAADPEAFWGGAEQVGAGGGALTLLLKPYETSLIAIR
jgi:hypothetical protein